MPAFGEFTESGHVKFILWEVMKTSNKHRINLALSPDNPLQLEALSVLAQVPPGTRTTLICQALCEYQKNTALVEKLRSVIREELSNASIQTAPETTGFHSKLTGKLARMRIMIGIKLRKFVSMRITVSMKSAEFCPNPYHCTYSNGNTIQTLRNVHTHPEKELHQGHSSIGQP